MPDLDDRDGVRHDSPVRVAVALLLARPAFPRPGPAQTLDRSIDRFRVCTECTPVRWGV